ncbi:MAG: HupE/UreJ family protein [Methylococcaceae bacterium]|nr:HupE/UreJ family protein [Methylococcaceae bacterium]
MVEPAIAASIVYVGARSLTGTGRGHGIYLAFGFGLVHGLGFAGALAESLAGGIHSGRYWISDLAAFNLGIESLQLVVAGIAFALLERSRQQPWAGPATATASFAVMAAGMGWLAVRIATP